MSLCHIHSARSLSARPSCFGSDRLLRSLHSYRFAQPMVHLRLSAMLATALFLSAADPHASGPGCLCLCRSHRSHRNAPRDYHRRYCRVCFVLSVDYRPSCFGSDNRLRSLHAHRTALSALIPLAGWLLTHPSFRTTTRPAPFAHLALSVFMLAHSVVMLAHSSLINSLVHLIHTAQLFNGKCFVMFVRCL